MSCGYDPFKWADEPYEDIEEYQKQFKEDAKKIIEEMEICLQQRNEENISEEVTSQE